MILVIHLYLVTSFVCDLWMGARGFYSEEFVEEEVGLFVEEADVDIFFEEFSLDDRDWFGEANVRH